VLSNSGAHPSQNIDDHPKVKNQKSSNKPSSRSTWLKIGTKPVWGTLQLWIFLSCNTNGAIDVFTRRVGRWEVNDFVVAL